MEVLELEVNNSHKAEVEALKMQVQELNIELVLCKTCMAKGAVLVQVAPKVDVPKSKEFKGNLSIKEVDNFACMEQYFGAVGIQDEMAKVRNISLFLTNNAML